MKLDINSTEFLDNNDIFADIINVNYFDGKQVIIPEELENVLVSGEYKDIDGTEHKLVRDSFKKVRKHHGGYIAVIGCESQRDINRAMPVKDMGYVYAGYAKQVQELVADNRKSGRNAYARVLNKDQRLLPICTCVLYFGKEPWESPLSLMDILDIPDEDKEFWKAWINDYRIHVIHLAGQPENIRNMYRTEVGVIADYLANSHSTSQVMKAMRMDNRKIYHVEQTLDLLKALSSDARFEKMKDRFLENEKTDIEERKEMDTMCLLLDAVENEGIQKGMERGIAQGESLGEMKKLVALVCRKLRKNKSIEMIAFELEEEYSVIESICNCAEKYSPEYDEVDVYREYMKAWKM